MRAARTELYKVFVSTAHPGAAVESLCKLTDCSTNASPEPLSKYELLRRVQQGYDCLVSVLEDKLDSTFFQQCPDLKVVANVAVGFDNIDVNAANQHGVLVLNTPGVLDNATADLAMTLLLCTSRRILEAERFLRSGRWTKWRSDLLLGTSLEGKTLGIIGLGRIGQALARRARVFQMKIIYTQGRKADPALEDSLGNPTFVQLEELLRCSDAISVHCPLTPETHHLLGRLEFAKMKSGCILINTSRGPIIDEKALIEALSFSRIAAAGLDVYEFEPKVSLDLLSLHNVVLLPHVGSATVETRSKMAQLAADGLLTALSGQMPANAVNPAIWNTVSKRLSTERD